ncbi:hypothetical protein N6H14_13995 [Paenibacillus sp. CC-CFT747]|nr:hypothetical protein N6H14_13995 [Paenibacillus sp. CC-CFT747]
MLTPGELAARLNRLVLSILLTGHRKCGPDWQQPPHHPPSFLLADR